MKAMLFAAGLGSRLYPLTSDRPKALVEINGKTLLQHCIEYLNSYGIKTIVINIHHFGEQILKLLEANNNFNCNIIISDERDLLLETGGGLKKASEYLNGSEPIVLYNVDVISNIDLKKLVEFHQNNSALATLATRHRKSSRYLLFNDKKQLCGWKNTNTSEVKICREASNLTEYAFSGIQMISPEFLKLIKQEGKFSIILTYLNLANKYNILCFEHDNDYWFDVGNVKKLDDAKCFFKTNEIDF